MPEILGSKAIDGSQIVMCMTSTLAQWRSEGPAGPAIAGARGAEGARQEEVVTVSP